MSHFARTGADVAAGVKQQLEADMAGVPGLRLLPGRFMTIRQAGLSATRLRTAAVAMQFELPQVPAR